MYLAMYLMYLAMYLAPPLYNIPRYRKPDQQQEEGDDGDGARRAR